MKAGTSTRSERSSVLGGHGFLRHVDEQLEVLVAHVLCHEDVQRLRAALEGLLGGDLVGDQRPDAGVVGASAASAP